MTDEKTFLKVIINLIKVYEPVSKVRGFNEIKRYLIDEELIEND